MNASVEGAPEATPDPVLDSVIAIWSELKSHLERRSKELNDEVRNYPTPIARCDEQLTKLIEQRSRAMNELKRMTDTDLTHVGAGTRLRLGALEEFLMGPVAVTDDESEMAIRVRLKEVLSSLRDRA